MRRVALMCLCVSMLALFAGAGCTLGYRYHNLDTTIDNAAGANAQVQGSGHTLEMGVVLDFRYLRVISAYLFPTYEFDIEDDLGGGGHHYSQRETRGFRLDVPLLSVWNEDEQLGYPGTMVHRKSLELWASVAGRPEVLPLWWADLGLVYYHHDALAFRLFGGWGGAPYDGSTTRLDEDGSQYQFWETTAQGYTAGFEVTLGAGEQALDFFKFFIEQQDAAGKQPQ